MNSICPQKFLKSLLSKALFFMKMLSDKCWGILTLIKVLRALYEQPALPLEDLASILVHESDRLSVISRLSEAHIANYSVKALRLTGYGMSFMDEYRERIK